MPRISVFTPTRGEQKLPYLRDAMSTLQEQVMSDWEWWILDNNDAASQEVATLASLDRRVAQVWDNDFDRTRVHPMPYLLNKYYPEARGDLVFYLSDDDLLNRDTFRVFTEFFDANPKELACWVSLQHLHVNDANGSQSRAGHWIPANERRGSGCLDNRVDGGQVCHRKSLLEHLRKPWFPESADLASARHCDGQFMEKASRFCDFVPAGDVGTPYVMHRFTPVSTFTPGSA